MNDTQRIENIKAIARATINLLEIIDEQDAEIALLKEKLKEALLHKVGPRQRNVESQEG
jgi:hypothetical protein